MGKDEMDINIYEAFKALRKRWVMIVEIVLLCTIVTVVYSFFIAKPVYSTSTKLFIGKQLSDDSNTYDSNDVNMYQKLMETYAGFAESTDLIENAMSDAKLDLNVTYVKNCFQVTTSSEDQFLTFTYNSEKIDEGVKVLDAITNEFISESSQYIPNGNVQVVESPRYPSSPISPNKIKNIAIAIVLGLFLGLGLALFLEYLDNTVKKKEEIEALLEVPVIGIVPESDDEDEEEENKTRKKKKHFGKRGDK